MSFDNQDTIAAKRGRSSTCTMVGFILLTIGAGMLHPTQAGLNILLMSHLNGEAIRASFVSFAVGSLALSSFSCYDCKGQTIPRFSHLFSALNENKIEYLLFLNGVLAAFYVTAMIYIAPLIGFALYFICVVTGQMILSSILDFKQHSFKAHLFRFGGILILVGGVVICEVDGLLSSTNKDDKHWYMSIIYCLIGVLVGFAAVTRAFMNRRFEHHLQNSYFASFLNFINGCMVCFVVAFVQWLVVENSVLSENNGNFTIGNCYVWFGGICGAIYLTIVSIIMPGYVGYVGSYICAICGNLFMSTVYDTLGVFHGTRVPLTTMRIVGIALVFIAVIGVNLPKLFAQSRRGTEKQRDEDTWLLPDGSESLPLRHGRIEVDNERITPQYGLVQL